MNINNQFVSIILAVFNSENYLENSIKSILNQTYKNFEFIIINDGSTDNSDEIIKSYQIKDQRIMYLINKENIGLTRSLIKAIEKSKGEIIFRQDADEISSPKRIAEQLTLFNNKSIVAIGSNSLAIYPNKSKIEWGFIDEQQIKKIVNLKTIFPHGTSSFRKNIYFDVGGYDLNFLTCQDFDLWNKLITRGRVLMLGKILVERYIESKSISNRRKFRQFYDSLKIRIKYSNDKKDVLYKICYSFYVLIIKLLPNRIFLYLKGGKNL